MHCTATVAPEHQNPRETTAMESAEVPAAHIRKFAGAISAGLRSC